MRGGFGFWPGRARAVKKRSSNMLRYSDASALSGMVAAAAARRWRSAARASGVCGGRPPAISVNSASDSGCAASSTA